MHQRKTWIISLAIGLLLSLTSLLVLAAPIQITQLQVSPDSHGTQITLNLDNSAKYHVFTLPNPTRLVIDLPNAQLAAAIDHLTLTNTFVLKIREGHPAPNILRLVFDLNNPIPSHDIDINSAIPNQLVIHLLTNPVVNLVNAPATALQQTQQWTQENVSQNKVTPIEPQKVVLQNSPAPIAPPLPTAAPAPAEIKAPVGQVQDQPLQQAQNLSIQNSPPEENNNTQNNDPRRNIVVVIDPGHGGKDPGTTSPNGIHEKNVVLAISRDLYQLLQKEPGFHPTLTRHGDYFIPLRGRLAIARQNKGDMFIAIHADAASEPGATGAAVFALSEHGASSEAARWLAEKENYSELGDVTLSDKSNMLRSVLIDLSQTATISSSMQLGSALLPQLAKVERLHYGVVEQAPFMVLKSPDIPSLLVETGFLSNPLEERRLNDPSYQQKIAEALCAGIKNYFWNNPPLGTLVAALKKNKNVALADRN